MSTPSTWANAVFIVNTTIWYFSVTRYSLNEHKLKVFGLFMKVLDAYSFGNLETLKNLRKNRGDGKQWAKLIINTRQRGRICIHATSNLKPLINAIFSSQNKTACSLFLTASKVFCGSMNHFYWLNSSKKVEFSRLKKDFLWYIRRYEFINII